MRFLFLTIVLLVFSMLMFSQTPTKDEKPVTIKDRFFLGLHFNMQVNGAVTLTELTPSAGFRFYPWFAAGIKLPYEFYHEKVIAHTVNSHIFGIGAFTTFQIISDFSKVLPVKSNGGLFAQLEYENLNFENYILNASATNSSERAWNQTYFGGIGLNQKINKRSSVYILCLLAYSPSNKLIYQNPVIRFGFTF